MRLSFCGTFFCRADDGFFRGYRALRGEAELFRKRRSFRFFRVHEKICLAFSLRIDYNLDRCAFGRGAPKRFFEIRRYNEMKTINRSERSAMLYTQINGRIFTQEEREGTYTPFDKECKTPFLDAFEKHSDTEPYVVCLAHAIVDSWLCTEPVIHDGEIIIGEPRPRRLFWEHFAWGIEPHADISEYEANGYESVEDLKKRMEKLSEMMAPMRYSHVRNCEREFFGEENLDKVGMLWGAGAYQGHTVPNYRRLLSDGIGKTLRYVKECAAQTDDSDKTDFYRALEIILEGFSSWVRIYADYAEKAAAAEKDSVRADELSKIAANCRAVAEDAPVTFFQAAQLMWFYCLWDCVDCVGRLDQYMFPFVLNSRRSGDVFDEDDIIFALMYKMWEFGVHNITVSGSSPDGKDETNDLTYKLLQALHHIHSTHPRMSVRIHKKTPKELWKQITSMWASGMSDPTVVSDTVVPPALIEYGVTPEDAYDYTMLGCQEIEIPGKSNFGCEDGSFNIAKVLEYTLNNGKCRKTGAQMSIETGYLHNFKSFDELWDAYTKQLSYLVKPYLEFCGRGVDIRNGNFAKLVKSAFTDDCIKKGHNLDDGGAVYNFGVIETVGAAAAADSLTAIKKLVFEEKKVDARELEAALDANFEGYENLRRMLADVPKFGNNDDEVDEMACRVLDFFWREIRKYKSGRGDVYMGACSMLMGGIFYGSNMAACADGTLAGAPLGNTIGARTGNAKSGLTSHLASVAKLPLELGTGGTTCNIQVMRSLLQGSEAREKVASLLAAFLENGGQMAQVTTAELEELKAAKESPELYPDLLVRVGGYSAPFVELPDFAQDEIVLRYSEDEAL